MLFCLNYIDWGKSLFDSSILIETKDRGGFPRKMKFDPPTSIKQRRVTTWKSKYKQKRKYF